MVARQRDGLQLRNRPRRSQELRQSGDPRRDTPRLIAGKVPARRPLEFVQVVPAENHGDLNVISIPHREAVLGALDAPRGRESSPPDFR